LPEIYIPELLTKNRVNKKININLYSYYEFKPIFEKNN